MMKLFTNVCQWRDMDMDNDEFMKLMNELCIPDENIIECHEPEDSLETLRNLETQYAVFPNQLTEEF